MQADQLWERFGLCWVPSEGWESAGALCCFIVGEAEQQSSNFSLGDVSKCLFTPDKAQQQTKLWLHQSLFGEIRDLLSLITDLWTRGYLQKYGWPPNSFITVSSHPIMDSDLMETAS